MTYSLKRRENPSIQNEGDSCWIHQEMRRRSATFVDTKLIQEHDKGLIPENFQQCVHFMALIKSCAKNKDLYNGSALHNKVLKSGLLQKSPYLGSGLINMYVRCGMLDKAQKVLDDLPVRNVVVWSTLISGYAQHDQGYEALNCFEQMQKEGFPPDAIAFMSALKACGSVQSIDKGHEIHKELVNRNLLRNDIMLGTSLVDMYAKCGMVIKAQEVLESLPVRNIVSWNALVAGYVLHGQCDEAVKCFEHMQNEGFSPNAVTYASLLKVCGNTKDMDKGKNIHIEVGYKGWLKNDIVLGNALVDMYSKCGAFPEARKVLSDLPVRNVVSWSALISGYVQYGQDHEALNCLEQMVSEGISPNEITYIGILNACGSAKNVHKGAQIHKEIVSKDMLRKDVTLGNALVNMYAKCGALVKAQKILKEFLIRDVDTFSALIEGYVEHGQPHEALCCHEDMENEGFYPNTATFISILRACGSTRSICKGKKIHEDIVNRGLLKKDALLGSALINMYAKCGLFAKAQQVLKQLPTRDNVSWCALIVGYAEHGQAHEALSCFEHMQNDGLSPDVVTFICILKACGNIGAIGIGKQIHDEIVTRGLLAKDAMLGTSLVDMYSKCGLFAKAEEVLKELPVRDLVTWSTLIAGYSRKGFAREALNCFKQMESEGIFPDDVTFLSVLSACGHSGLSDEAEIVFESMTTKYGISPNLEHHTTMIVIFGGAGQFNKAISVIKAMPFSHHSVVWITLLGVCRKWGNVKLGKLAFDQALQVDHNCAAAFVLLANLFAEAGMQEDAEKTEAMGRKYGCRK